MFRILTKIPYFFLLAWGVILLFLTAFFFPFGTESDVQFFNLIANQGLWSFRNTINVHNIFSFFINLVLDSYEIRSLYGYRFLNLIYFSLLIFTLYKIIKLQFYDLKIFPVLTAITCTGVIFISILSLHGILLIGLISLIIFYFQIKFFIEDKTYNSFFLGLFCIIALSLGNYFFLLIVTTLSILKLLDWKIEKNKRFAILSNLSFIYILAIIFVILDHIYGEQILFKINLSLSEILKRTYLVVGLLLPIIGILIISFYFNLLKKINWNKDLFLYLLLIAISIVAFIFFDNQIFSIIIFILSILTIYIFRTLEFVELKWLRLFYLSFLLLPAFVIYFDTSLYPTIEAVSKLNYIFYALIIIIGFINPAFSLQSQLFVESYKIIIFSFLLLVSISLSFFVINYQNQFLHIGISETITNDLSCDLEKTQITASDENPAISLYFSQNLNPTYFPDCEIELSFTSLNEAPIDNPSSINKTLLDLNQKSFINVNFIKK
jgi:hypothetical protein